MPRQTPVVEKESDRPDEDAPAIDDRLFDVERTLSFLVFVISAIASGGDLAESDEVKKAAFYEMRDIADRARANLIAVRAALPQDAAILAAPDSDGGVR